ncbi:MAG: hypothetical protein RBS89_07640 [Candidatus Delongbacteria bacterium]|nr:hypothetical protein [Candidatus Delongbacteria bacterium]
MRFIVKIQILIMAAAFSLAFSKDYYIKQMLVADADDDGRMDSTFQETYISDKLVVVMDEMSLSYLDDESFSFYNNIDSSYFRRTFKELEELMTSSDSQIKEFKLTRTEEKKKIGAWDTEKYTAKAVIMGMDMDLDMYIAKNTGFPSDLIIRQQGKMNQNSKNIKDMMEKIKNTGGIVIKEIARIGGTQVSEKEIVSIKELEKLDKKITDRPKGYKLMEQ